MKLLDTISDIISYVALLFFGFIGWFFKNVWSDHKINTQYVQQNEKYDLHKLKNDMANLKYEIQKVEGESKRYWQEQRDRAMSNHEIILERINHVNDNTKASSSMLVDYLEKIEKRIEKVEDRMNK